MRALDLDFQPRRRASLPGWCLLLAGLVLGASELGLTRYIGEQAQEQDDRLRHAQSQLQGQGRTQSTLSPAEAREQQARLAEMQQISKQLRRPWERLFATLESLQGKDIALLSLTPDARKGQVRISAEARDLEAMLTFHKQLEDSAELSDVSLLNHEIIAQSPQHPILFNLLATWEVNDVHP